MIDGRMQHQDSHGGGGMIEDGATQWMTAGSGILHIETPPEDLVMSGGLFHGVQLWVNLPAKEKMIPPAYQGIDAAAVKLAVSADAGALVRVIAGEVGGHRGPGSTHTPITLIHATVSPGARLQLPWDPSSNALIYVLAGAGRVGNEGRRPVRAGQLVVFGRGDWFEIRANALQDSTTPALELLILGGRPIREPVAAYGPFVMNSRAELGRAFEDFEAGLFGQIPPDALMPHVPDPAPIRTERTGI
jgi:redox-sensitive bicupin YhaK (pirin superfamily)